MKEMENEQTNEQYKDCLDDYQEVEAKFRESNPDKKTLWECDECEGE
jgi:hypothetical protein